MANGFFGDLINPQAQSPVPEAPAQVPAQPAVPPEQVAANTQRWTELLNDPTIMSGLMQFGINLTQPSWDSGAAPVFRALGEGMQAGGRAAALQREEASAAAEAADRAARTGIMQQELGVREQGQSQQYALGQQKIKADQAQLEREYALKKELAAMPPNLAELALKTWATIRANPPLHLRGPELAEWEAQQLTEAINAAKQTGSALTPGAAVAPNPTPGRVRIDAEGNILPSGSEVPTQ